MPTYASAYALQLADIDESSVGKCDIFSRTCQTRVCRRRSHGHIDQGQSPVHIAVVQERDSPDDDEIAYVTVR